MDRSERPMSQRNEVAAAAATAGGGKATLGEPRPERSPAARALGILWWVLRFGLALFLFVGALQLMKTGASGLDPGIVPSGAFPEHEIVDSELVRTRGIRLFN